MHKHFIVLLFATLIPACVADPPSTSTDTQNIGEPTCWDVYGDPIYDDGWSDGFALEADCYSYEDPLGGGGGGGGSLGTCQTVSTWVYGSSCDDCYAAAIHQFMGMHVMTSFTCSSGTVYTTCTVSDC